MSKLYPIQFTNDDGYCDWILPEMDKDYRMACCDCGLVHNMQFAVMRVKEDLGNGYKDLRPTKAGQFVVMMRAARNNRATGQIRRHKK